ncbi:hypothetical protein L0152_02920 [bacterium]|nr:hypothetical protein [bacterium]
MQKIKADVGASAEINQKLLENDTVPAEKGQSHPFGNFNCIDVLHSHSEKGTQKLNNKWLFKCIACGKRKLEVYADHDEWRGSWKCQSCQKWGNRWDLCAFLLGLDCYKGHELEVHHWLAGATSSLERTGARIFRYTLRKHTHNEPRVRITGNSKYLIPGETPVLCQPTIVKTCGGILDALIIQEIHHLCHSYKKDWMYHTLDEWCTRFPDWTRDTTRKKLRKMISENKIEHRKEKGRDEYRVNYKTVELLVQQDKSNQI